ncbi:Fructosamine/Ketosamine-3-kinase, partial [Trinorchestia longiramus]
SDVMFKGELESLRALHQTKTVRVPKPYLLVSDEESRDGTVVLVMEALDMKGGSATALLGSQLADLHLHNMKLRDAPSASRVTPSSSDDSDSTGVTYVDRFGFGVPTCCGFLPQDNEWCDDWQVFFARKLDYQIKRLETERSGASVREAGVLWSVLQPLLPRLFDDVPAIVPSLLHGDLWGGNVSSVEEQGVTVPVIFDPASFYGHHEYDLAIAMMFGGFSKSFFAAYFEKIPKASGWEKRNELYKLFHYLNHW